MKAADYVLVPDIANQNRNSGGTNVGGILGGLLPHGVGALVGGVSLKSKTADVVLTLTDVRSTEQVALEQGHAKKTDLGWMGGGGGGVLRRFRRRRCQRLRQYGNRPGGHDGLPRRLHQNGRRTEEQRARCQGRQRAAGGHDGQARQNVRGIKPEIRRWCGTWTPE